jgi:DNA gyrase subunit B
MPNSDYDTSNITVLTFPEGVRKRPAMFIGSLDFRGKKNLILNVINDYLNKNTEHKISIELTLKQADFIEISFESDTENDDFEATFNNDGVDINWLGVANSLSQYFKIITKKSAQVFERSELMSTKENDDFTKNTLLFKLDNTIFEDISILHEGLFSALKERAILNKNVEILYKDERKRHLTQNYFHYNEGVKSFIQEFELECSSEKKTTFYFEEKIEDISYEFGFFHDSYLEDNILISFMNYDKLRHHGSLTDGIIDGILETAKALRRDNIDLSEHFNKKDKFKFSKKKAIKGLRLFASVKMKDPHFAGSTKEAINEHIVYLDAKKMVFERLYMHYTSRKSLKPKHYWSELDTFLRQFCQY